MVEIIPKRPIRSIPLNNVFLFAAGVLLLTAIFSYVILLKSEAETLLVIQGLEEDIYKIGTKEDKKTEEKVFNYENKIKNFKALSAGRRESSKFFDNFEGLIHPQVWFSSFKFDPAEIMAVASGASVDFRTLEQQMIFLQSKEDIIESLDLFDVVLEKKGGVGFNLTINFTPKIFDTTEK